MIELTAALELIGIALKPLSGAPESVPLDAAQRRILDADVRAPSDVPGYVHSAMDGYAVLGSDLKPDAQTRLHCIGVRLAGRDGPGRITSGECLRITTGAPLPHGADTVVIKENSSVAGDEVTLAPGTAIGANVRRSDDDYARGDLTLRAGTLLDAAQLGVLASLGMDQVLVRHKLRVAVLTTGDELVAPGNALAFGQRYDSNGTQLVGLVHACAAEVVWREHVADDADAVRSCLLAAAACADLILTSGGVSAGEADLLPQTISQLGRIVFWKVRMRPGMPVLFGFVGATPVFSLPGNPVSVFATFVVLVRPALAQLAACPALLPSPRFARLCEAIDKHHGRLELRRARLEHAADGSTWARVHPSTSSGALRSVAESETLVELGADQRHFDVGTVVPVHTLP